AISKSRPLVHHTQVPGQTGDHKSWGISMRKAALFAAVMLAATLSTTSSNAASKPDPAIAAQQNAANFFRDALNPYAATSRPAAAPARKPARRAAKRSSKRR